MTEHTHAQSLASLVLPTAERRLLVPNHCVIEVVMAELSSSMSTDCVIGTVSWREHPVPVVAFEGLVGQALASPYPVRQLAVVQALTAADRMPYFAIVLSAIPHLQQLHQQDLQQAEMMDTELEVIHSQVVLNGDVLSIPHWDVVESRVLDALFGEGSWSDPGEATAVDVPVADTLEIDDVSPADPFPFSGD